MVSKYKNKTRGTVVTRVLLDTVTYDTETYLLYVTLCYVLIYLHTKYEGTAPKHKTRGSAH